MKRGIRLTVEDNCGAVIREMVYPESTMNILVADLPNAHTVQIQPVRIHDDGSVEIPTINGTFHSDGPYQTERDSK